MKRDCFRRTDMREILYRGKEIKTGKWVYGGFHEHKPFITAIGKQPETEALIIADGSADWGLPVPIKAYVVEKKTVGEYTGLTDKNGVRIYEGDIAEDTFGNTGVITYSDHFLDWRIVFFKGRPNLLNKLGKHIFEWVYPKMYLKIIGNIHDNPELLGRE
jgi:uncharacterized phage protein (TIGR01671 family)